MFAGNFAPVDWMFCNGQLLSISEYSTLFNLIGTTYGGDGQQTFALPNLQSRVPVCQGNTFVLGQPGGAEQVTLTVAELPAHTHAFSASTTTGNSSSPANNVAANSAVILPYYNAAGKTAMAASAITFAGSSQPHENRQPFLCIEFIISLFGIYPSPG
jgi:microcystin-dependent protein